MIIACNAVLDTDSVIIAWLVLADLFTVWQSYTAVLITYVFAQRTRLAKQNIALQLQPALLRCRVVMLLSLCKSDIYISDSYLNESLLVIDV